MSATSDSAPRLSVAAKLTLCALFIQAWFVLLHFRLAGHSTADVRVVGQAFDLTREGTIPTAFAAAQALAASIVAGVMVSLLRRQGGRRRRWVGWLGVMAVFFVIAIDDAASLHERINAVVSLDLIASLNYPSYPWHVVFAPILAGSLILTLWMVREDLTKNLVQKVLLVLGLVLFAVSQCFDFVEGWEIMTRSPTDLLSARYAYLMVAEEVLEMIGTSCFVYVFLTSLLLELNQRCPSWRTSILTQPNTP